MHKQLFICLFLALIYPIYGYPCSSADFINSADLGKIEEGCFYSVSANTNVVYKAYFPKNYKYGSHISYVIYLHGRGGNENQFYDFDKSHSFSKLKNLIVIAPKEPKASYWKDGSGEKLGVAKMIGEDLIEHIEENLGPKQNKNRFLLGISMGGHGAIYIGDKYAEKFAAIYSISPIFRRENELEEADRAGYGSGQEFRKNDPASFYQDRIAKGEVGFRFRQFRIEIGKDDTLLNSYPNTKYFLQQLQRDFGSQKVNTIRPGGHDSTYWSGALSRASRYFEKIRRKTTN
ncbi:MAG: alpha/beta hydrolase-fold protein [Oligoflexia bacterium]|nr:alpha/beta hydrolase-fold protein [Oligoflexia bacterium]